MHVSRGASVESEPCGDPESFVRGGPTVAIFFFIYFFIVDEGREDPKYH